MTTPITDGRKTPEHAERARRALQHMRQRPGFVAEMAARSAQRMRERKAAQRQARDEANKVLAAELKGDLAAIRKEYGKVTVWTVSKWLGVTRYVAGQILAIVRAEDASQ